MESESLPVLKEIIILLYILIFISAIGAVAHLVRAWILFTNMHKKERENVFNIIANDYHDEGKWEELILHCEEQLSIKPNHSYAIWYKGKAYYQKNEIEKAKSCFELLEKIEPAWSKSHVEPFLQAINQLKN